MSSIDNLLYSGQIAFSPYLIEGSLTVQDVHIPKRKNLVFLPLWPKANN